MLMIDWLSRAAEQNPERNAIEELETGAKLSYAELDLRVSRIGWVLKNYYGLSPGARVAMLSQNRAAHIEVLFACARAGFVFVPLNWRLPPSELRGIVQDAEPSLLMHEADFAGTAASLAEQTGCIPVALDDPRDYEAALSGADAGLAAMTPRSSDDLMMLLYTSGTTGRPKGVMQTFGMVYVNAVNTFLSGKVVPGDIHLNVLPFFHTGGLNLYTLPVLISGGTVIIARRFDPSATLARLSKDITSMFAVPAIYLALASHPDFVKVTFPHLRNLSVGGAPIPSALGEAFGAKDIIVAPSYGMTEAGPTIFAADLHTAATKPQSVGKPVGSALVRIVDKDGRELTGEARGELQIGGPVLTPGYWRSPGRNARCDSQRLAEYGRRRLSRSGRRYLHRRPAEGHVHFRWRECLSAEVENLLHSLPGIADVAVIGVPDQRWGEVGMAVVVASPGAAVVADQLRAACRVHLAGYKVPQHVRIVDALPRTPSGKVEKHKLRNQFAAISKSTGTV